MVLLPAAVAGAQRVNEVSGSFYIDMVDIPGTSELLSFSRSYDTKNPGRGIFGKGWTSVWDTRIKLRPDGALVLDEFGRRNVYTISRIPDNRLEDVVDRLLSVARETKQVVRPADEDELELRLVQDPALREKMWLEDAVRKSVPEALAEGSLYRGSSFGDRILRTPSGFVHIASNQEESDFDSSGELIGMKNTSGAVQFRRSASQLIVSDSGGHTLALNLDTSGRVVHAANEGGHTATYQYDQSGRLSACTPSDGHVIGYDYDAEGHIVRITRDGVQQAAIDYYGKEQYFSVKKLAKPDGTMEFAYDYSHLDDGHAVVSSTFSRGSRSVHGETQYFVRALPSGERFIYRTITTDFSDVTTTTDFNSLGQPAVIRRNGSVTRLEYDLFGRVTRKETSDSITELTFDPVVKKVSYVRRFNKDTRQVAWSRFSYTPAGELLTCADSDGLSLKFTYDPASGRITALEDQTGTTATFQYGTNGRIGEIDLKQNGNLSRVMLDAAGKPVDASAARDVVLRVSDMLTEMANTVKLAAIRLDEGQP